MTVWRPVSRPSDGANTLNFVRQQDLTFCYLHMTQNDLDVLDTIGTPDYFSGDLSDSGEAVRG